MQNQNSQVHGSMSRKAMQQMPGKNTKLQDTQTEQPSLKGAHTNAGVCVPASAV